jgi:hypothetical protein
MLGLSINSSKTVRRKRSNKKKVGLASRRFSQHKVVTAVAYKEYNKIHNFARHIDFLAQRFKPSRVYERDWQ